MTVTSFDTGTPETGQPPSTAGQEPDERPSRLRRLVSDPGKVWGFVGVPILVIAAWIALYVSMSGREFDFQEQQSMNADAIGTAFREHIQLSLIATLFVVAVAVPLGVLLTRPFAKPVTPLFIGLANVGQAIPSVGLLFLLALAIATGPRTAIIGVVAYCILPVLRNTMVGIQQVDPALIEAGRGMGMSKAAVLVRIEIPLAVPVMMAGVRTALILTVGTMALATFINGGGLGDIINAGIVHNRSTVLVTGAVLTAGLALLIDWTAGVAQELLRPKGL